MAEARPAVTVRRQDYAPPAFDIPEIALDVSLHPTETRVRATLRLRRRAPGPLALDHEFLTLVSLAVDGEAPDAIRREPGRTLLDDLPDSCTLTTESLLSPEANTELSGLYRSRGDYFSQCEAEGFRRITPFPDRPDVMSRYTVTLSADRALCPVLLSNGNRVDGGEGSDGTHWARFEDPHPKPCYLFAIVAGRLVSVRDTFRTRSGREVALAVWVRPGDEDRCGHALASLKTSMEWDERVYGFEYDLDAFHIAAVSDFNMGAMENKGLNVFNTRYVLARPETATDADYDAIEGVIAHEYFHNWTGNRVTCRDWFQLSLKEGLTVFRDQEFSADQGGRAVRRIADVRRLRAAQFPEDDGPLAHPVRPDRYVRIDNFYTATVYQKGAEIVRMIHTLLGPDGFRAGMDRYVARHDNQAVTIEDFLRAMEDASGVDLAHLSHWYAQAGTPVLSAHEAFDPERRRYVLTLSQATAPTPGQPDKAPLPIPVRMALLDEAGAEAPSRLAGEAAPVAGTRLLLLDASEQEFAFEDVAHRPTPSLLRGFSAPVRLTGLAPDRLAFLAAHDTDPFVRWDSFQEYATGAMLELIEDWRAGRTLVADRFLLAAMAATLDAWEADPAFAAEALMPPTEAAVGDRMETLDAAAVHAVRRFLVHRFVAAEGERLRALLPRLAEADPLSLAPAATGRRALANLFLGWLADEPDGPALALARFRKGSNLTERLGGLVALCRRDTPERDAALAEFREAWRDEALMHDRWLAVQALAPAADTPARVRALYASGDFDLGVPNAVRALVGGFAANQVHFHAGDGGGYRFLGDAIRALDPVNAQVAARLVSPLGVWRRLDPAAASRMRAVLDGILAMPGLSAGTEEMARRASGRPG